MKSFLRIIEYIFLYCILSFLKKLPVTLASNICAFIMRFIGPWLPISRIGKINLRLAMPHLTAKDHQDIIRKCWDNIGRNLAELPHISTLSRTSSLAIGWRIVGEEWLEKVKSSKRPIIFFSGHLNNWEIMPTAITQWGLPVASFYREPNNPYVNNLLSFYRKKNVGLHEIPFFAKGAKGARLATRYIAQGGNIGILGDQKMNDGICVNFFNRPTMSTSSAAVLALKFNALIVPGYVKRDGAARFTLIASQPIDPNTYCTKSQSRHATISHITQILNNHLEEWIIKNPGSWLWFHRRWDKKFYR